MEWIPIGKLIKTHGFKGEVEFGPSVRDSTIYINIKRVALDDEAKVIKQIQSFRGHESRLIIKLKDCNSIEDAQKLCGSEVFIHRDDFESLPDGDHYWFEILGLQVYDEDGKHYGHIVEIMETGSNDVYVVQDGKKELLLPMIDSVVKSISVKENKLVFRVVEGLL